MHRAKIIFSSCFDIFFESIYSCLAALVPRFRSAKLRAGIMAFYRFYQYAQADHKQNYRAYITYCLVYTLNEFG